MRWTIYFLFDIRYEIRTMRMISWILTSPNPATIQRVPDFEIKGNKSIIFFLVFGFGSKNISVFCLEVFFIDLSIISKTSYYYFVRRMRSSSGSRFIQKEVEVHPRIEIQPALSKYEWTLCMFVWKFHKRYLGRSPIPGHIRIEALNIHWSGDGGY